MQKNKKMLYILLSIVAIGLLVFSIFKISDNFSSSSDGSIVVRILDDKQNIVSEKVLDFNEGDNLETMIEDNFNGVLFEDGMLMNAEGLKTPSDFSYFFWMTVNGIDSTCGASDLEFKDKDVIELTFTKNTYEAS